MADPSKLPGWFDTDGRKQRNTQSAEQEKRRVTQTGGRRQPGSGNTPYARHDVRTEDALEELKFRANSYTIKAKDWIKFRNRAITEGREPRLILDFPSEGVRLIVVEEPLR